MDTRSRLFRSTFESTRVLAQSAALIFLVACSNFRITAPSGKGDQQVHPEKDFAVNAQEMRLRMRGEVQPLCGVIVAAADQIMAGTTNNAVRRQALLWKIDAVPALREALFRPNPKAAVFDAWVMSIQMAEYFEKGAGKAGLGEAHTTAVETCRALETELSQIAASFTISGDVSKARDSARKWASENPIRGSIAGRASTLNRILEVGVADSFSAGEMVGNVAVTLDDLNRRIEIYTAQLPEQARWQAELFTMDFTGDTRIEKALPMAESAVKSASRATEALDRLVPAIERSLAMVEKAPELISSEREETVKALQTELTRSFTMISEERIVALKHLTDERIAAMHDLHETVRQERIALSEQFNNMSVAAVDHAFLRAAQLSAVLLVAIFIAAVVLLFIIRRLFPPH